jgi:toxin HigB-1
VEVTFEEERFAHICNSEKELQAEYGVEVSSLIRRRLVQLSAAPTLEDLRRTPGHCHELGGDRKGELAVDLHGSRRLMFRPTDQDRAIGSDGALKWAAVTAVTVRGIADEPN